MNKIVATALALSMLAGGPALAKSVKVVSVVVAKGGSSAYASSSTSASVSSNGTATYSAKSYSSGPNGGSFLFGKANGIPNSTTCGPGPCSLSSP